MSDDTAKFEAIAPTLRWMPKWVRENLSPRAAWMIIVAAFTCGVWITREESHRADLEAQNATFKSSQDSQAQAINKVNDTVAELNTKVAVLLSKVDDIGHRVDEQQNRWDTVSDVAERVSIPKTRAAKPKK